MAFLFVIHLATGRDKKLTEQFIKDKNIADITDVLSMTVPGERGVEVAGGGVSKQGDVLSGGLVAQGPHLVPGGGDGPALLRKETGVIEQGSSRTRTSPTSPTCCP